MSHNFYIAISDSCSFCLVSFLHYMFLLVDHYLTEIYVCPSLLKENKFYHLEHLKSIFYTINSFSDLSIVFYFFLFHYQYLDVLPLPSRQFVMKLLRIWRARKSLFKLTLTICFLIF